MFLSEERRFSGCRLEERNAQRDSPRRDCTSGSGEIPAERFYSPAKLTIPPDSLVLWPRSRSAAEQPTPVVSPCLREVAIKHEPGRYSVAEWQTANQEATTDSQRVRANSQRARLFSADVISRTGTDTCQQQAISSQVLAKRAGDVEYWRREAASEALLNAEEDNNLSQTKARISRTLRVLEIPRAELHRALCVRKQRACGDDVQDSVEDALNHELQIIEEFAERACRLLEQIQSAACELANTRQTLEHERRDKFTALLIEGAALQLNNSSPSLRLRPDIELVDNSVQTEQAWKEAAADLVDQSQAARASSQQLGLSVLDQLQQLSQQLEAAAAASDHAIDSRIHQEEVARDTLRLEMNGVLAEIEGLECSVAALETALRAQLAPLQVNQTRQAFRTHRPCMELTTDTAMSQLKNETSAIFNNVDQLKKQLEESNCLLQELLARKANLERHLLVKANTLLIDRDQIAGGRRTFNLQAMLKNCI